MPERFKWIGYLAPFEGEKICFLAPKSPYEANWKQYFKIFDEKLWLAMLVLFFLCSIFMIGYSKLYPRAEISAESGFYGLISIFLNQNSDVVTKAKYDHTQSRTRISSGTQILREINTLTFQG